jgi:polyketide synthase PksN
MQPNLPSRRRILELIRDRQISAEEGYRLLRQDLAGCPPARSEGGEIAVIGISGRYPQAQTPEQLWANLKEGRNCISAVPPERWNAEAFYDPSGTEPGKSRSKWGGFIDGVDLFDPLFFHISPAEAELMDPQERLFLEKAWEVLEDAGYSPGELQRSSSGTRLPVGVFVGCIYRDVPLLATDPEQAAFLSTTPYYSIANRISHFLNFGGPSMVVNTACSSSLMAIHLAVQSLRRGECAVAVAGGVNLHLHPNRFVGVSQIGLLSQGDRSRSLGESDGFVFGEGVGAVMLKPLGAAVRDGDFIYGVIKGSFAAHAGGATAYAAPNAEALTDLALQAFAETGIDPRTITCLELSANGSELGDAMEVEGLTHAFGRFSAERGTCALGSVKSNLGNIEAAAGVAQLTKVLLQMRHRTLVPSIHADPPNPRIHLRESPFFIPTRPLPWTREAHPRRAAINAVGIGGSLVLLLVEEYDQADTAPSEPAGAAELFLFSARNPARLKALAERYVAFLERGNLPALCDVAYTLRVGREPMSERLAVVAGSREELLALLAAYLQDRPEGRVMRGTVRRRTAEANDPDGLRRRAEAGDLQAVGEAWVRGARVDWSLLPRGRRVPLPTYPFTRTQCRLPAASGKALPIPPVPEERGVADARTRVLWELKQLLSLVLKIPAEAIETSSSLREYGLDSLTGMRLANRMATHFGRPVSVRALLTAATLEEMADVAVREGCDRGEAPGRASGTGAEPAYVHGRLMSFLLQELDSGALTPEQALALEQQWTNVVGGDGHHEPDPRGDLPAGGPEADHD